MTKFYGLWVRQRGGRWGVSYSCRMRSWSSFVKSNMAAMFRSEMTNSASVCNTKGVEVTVRCVRIIQSWKISSQGKLPHQLAVDYYVCWFKYLIWRILVFEHNWGKIPTVDFACSIAVYDLSHFPTQDLRRKLVFPLKGMKSALCIQGLNRSWALLCLHANIFVLPAVVGFVCDALTRSISAFSSSIFCFLSFSQWSSSMRKY